jgi:type IV pilus assembly protein PilQ
MNHKTIANQTDSDSFFESVRVNTNMQANNRVRTAVRGLMLSTALGLVPLTAWAQNLIESINSVPLGSSTQLRVKLKTPLAATPPGFTINNPPRIAIDLAGVEGMAAQGAQEFSQGDVRSVNVVQAAGRSRLVLNLRRAVAYTTENDGSTLIINLAPASVAAVESKAVAATAAPVAMSSAPTALSTTPVAAVASNQPMSRATGRDMSVRDIDFRRGKEGEGRVVVDLADPQTAVDIRLQGNTVVVDFLRSRLPENLRRRLDVADFGTPVKTIRTTQQGDLVRMVIEPQGLWEHNAYQSDSQFILEVKPVAEDPNKLFQGTRIGYKGDKLSLNFQAVDVRALLQVIADFTNLNIVTSDSVAGSLTLRLKDVPWDQALDIIMKSKGLDMRKNGNVLMIAPREELATKEKLELEAKQQISEIEPLRSEMFQLNYQKAEALGKMLSDDKTKVLSKRGTAVVDARTNKLFVHDTASRLEEVRRLITQVDVPVRQVLIEARIVEADDRFSRNLGAKLGFNDLSSTIYSTVARNNPVTGVAESINVPVYGAGSRLVGSGYGSLSGNLSGVQDISSQNGTSISGTNRVGLGRTTAQDNALFVNMPANGIGGTNAGSFAISLFGSSLTKFINLELSALEADQRGKVISSPRIMVMDQDKGKIEQGTELPFQTATSSGATAVTFRKANLSLEVTPQITPEGGVILDVQINKDSVGQLTSAGFAIDTRAAKTKVLVENGGTVVIGGIYEQFERNRETKVPFLGDIPYLGRAFKSNSRTTDRTELLVFLTPRVVTDASLSR